MKTDRPTGEQKASKRASASGSLDIMTIPINLPAQPRGKPGLSFCIFWDHFIYEIISILNLDHCLALCPWNCSMNATILTEHKGKVNWKSSRISLRYNLQWLFSSLSIQTRISFKSIVPGMPDCAVQRMQLNGDFKSNLNQCNLSIQEITFVLTLRA